jgi:hypothetical protein
MENRMTIAIKSIALAAAVVVSMSTLTLAEDAHHPDATPAPSTPASPNVSTPQSPTGGMAMMPMMEMMMGKGMPMMSGMSMPGMDMANRVEGRIAFLRAELKITPAQTKSWDAFAQALRDNAKKLGDMRPHMGMAGQPNSKPTPLVQQLEHQEHWYAARLSGIQAIKTAFSPLYAALSDEQKKVADELMPQHLGLKPVGMSFH